MSEHTYWMAQHVSSLARQVTELWLSLDQISSHVAQLQRALQHKRLVERAAAPVQLVAQRMTGHILHHQEGVLLDLEVIPDPCQAGVVERCQHARTACRRRHALHEFERRL